MELLGYLFCVLNFSPWTFRRLLKKIMGLDLKIGAENVYEKIEGQ